MQFNKSVFDKNRNNSLNANKNKQILKSTSSSKPIQRNNSNSKPLTQKSIPNQQQQKTKKDPYAHITSRLMQPIHRINNHFAKLPMKSLMIIQTFAISNFFEAQIFSTISRLFLNSIESNSWLWIGFIQKKFKQSGIPLENEKEFYIQLIKQEKLKGLQNWVNKYLKLFDYNTSKMNVPNKIFKEINLKPKVRINGVKTKEFLWKVSDNNYSSHIQIKLNNLQKISLNLESQELLIQIKIISKKFNFLFHEYTIKTKVQELLKNQLKLKAFNLILQDNIILPFFEGSNTFLYGLFQMSLFQIFSSIITQAKAFIVKNKASFKLPPIKSLTVRPIQYLSLKDYLSQQLDFELIIRLHNNTAKIFFELVNLKIYPTVENDKYIEICMKPNEQFIPQDFFLDNKMGISEKVQIQGNLMVVELVYKDKDHILINYSGFNHVKDANIDDVQDKVDNYLEFDREKTKVQNLIIQQDGWRMEMVCIGTKSRNLVKWINLRIEGELIMKNIR